METIKNSNELKHFVIPGMKWGKRRAFVRNFENVKEAKKNLDASADKYNKLFDIDYKKYLSSRKELKKAKRNIKDKKSAQYTNIKKQLNSDTIKMNKKLRSSLKEFQDAEKKYRSARKEASVEFYKRLSKQDPKANYKYAKIKLKEAKKFSKNDPKKRTL